MVTSYLLCIIGASMTPLVKPGLPATHNWSRNDGETPFLPVRRARRLPPAGVLHYLRLANPAHGIVALWPVKAAVGAAAIAPRRA